MSPAGPSSRPPWWRRLQLGFRGLADLDPQAEVTRLRQFLATQVRVTLQVFRWDVYEHLRLHAQALTLATLLALVPALAVMFAMFRAFGGLADFEAQLESFIFSNISGGPELREKLSTYIQQFVDNVQTGKLGAISVAILVFSVLTLLGHIERSFNTIFAAKAERPWGVRLVTYWGILTLGPVLLSASLALTAALQSTRAAGWFSDLGSLSAFAVRSTPLLITWLGFALLYMVAPTPRVRFQAALIAAVVAGSLWNIAKYAYAYYARHNVTTQDIYGSLAAIPLFILWLYVSWLLVLFGAQLTFALQNARAFAFERRDGHPTAHMWERTACRVFLEIACDFYRGQDTSTPESLAERLKLSRRFCDAVTDRLTTAGFVRETATGTLVPATDLGRVNLNDVVTAIRNGDRGGRPVKSDEASIYLEGIFEEMDQERQRIAGGLSFHTLAQRFAPESVPARVIPRPEAEIH